MKICSYYKNFLKIAVCAAVALLFYNRSDAQIYGAYWSFNDLTTTAWTTASPTVNTLPSATLVRAGSALNNYNNTAVMGSATYTAFDSSSHIFNQDSGARRSMAWDIGSTGNSFTLQLNTTGYKDFQVRLDYRRGAAGTSPTAFDAFEYSLDSGITWIAISGYPALSTASNTYTAWSHDLSSLSAIENVSSVWLRWTFGTVAGNNFRIDNVEITGQAIPEPGHAAMVGLLILLAWLARKKFPTRCRV